MLSVKIGFFSEPTRDVEFLKEKSFNLVLIMMKFHILLINKVFTIAKLAKGYTSFSECH